MHAPQRGSGHMPSAEHGAAHGHALREELDLDESMYPPEHEGRTAVTMIVTAARHCESYGTG